MPTTTTHDGMRKAEETVFSVAWCMPSRWTFSMAPVSSFLDRWLSGCAVVADPFAGQSLRGTLRNDLAAGGMDAKDWCATLAPESCDAILFDPPYSPRQISEVYRGVGRKVTMQDTQSSFYGHVRRPLASALKPGGVALSFGWQSSGFGKAWPTLEILLVRHGGAHNDTICVAQRKPFNHEDQHQ